MIHATEWRGARDPTHGADMVAKLVALSDGEYNREQQGRLRGPKDTYIGFVIPGGNDRLREDLEGQTVQLHPVTLRTDEDGLLEAVVDDATDVETLDESENSSGTELARRHSPTAMLVLRMTLSPLLTQCQTMQQEERQTCRKSCRS